MRLRTSLAAVAITGATAGVIGRGDQHLPDAITASNCIKTSHPQAQNTSVVATHPKSQEHEEVGPETRVHTRSVTAVVHVSHTIVDVETTVTVRTVTESDVFLVKGPHDMTVFPEPALPSQYDWRPHTASSTKSTSVPSIKDSSVLSSTPAPSTKKDRCACYEDGGGGFDCESVDAACTSIDPVTLSPQATRSSKDTTQAMVESTSALAPQASSVDSGDPFTSIATVSRTDVTYTHTVVHTAPASVASAATFSGETASKKETGASPLSTLVMKRQVLESTATFTPTIPLAPTPNIPNIPAITGTESTISMTLDWADAAATVAARNQELNCDCTFDEFGVVYCPPGPDDSSLCETLVTIPFAKRAAATENPTSVLASLVSNTNIWPSGASPFMAPTAAAPSAPGVTCFSDLLFSFQLATSPHGSTNSPVAARDVVSNVLAAEVNLVNGTLIDSLGRIGSIVANAQFQFDGPPQAGVIYDAGWSVCNPNDGKGYRLTLGGNMTMWGCASGGFDNIYAWSVGEQCAEIDVLILSKQPSSDASIQQETSVSAPAATTADPAITPTSQYNQWARSVVVDGEEHTFWEPYSFITHSGTKYSVSPVTLHIPYPASTPAATSSAGIQKRDVDHDEPEPLNYETNTYTITKSALVGVDRGESGAPDETWTIPGQIITVTERPYTYTTAATSLAARGVTPTPPPCCSEESTTSTDSWLTFVSTVPATIVTSSPIGQSWTTFTEPERTYTSLYKTTPYVTTWTYTNGAEEVTYTDTSTVEPPTFTTSSSASKHMPSDATFGVRAVTATASTTEEQPLIVSTATAVVSVPVTTVYVIPEPATAVSTSTIVSDSILTTSSGMSILTTTATDTATTTVTASPAASTTSQLEGAASANGHAFSAALGMGVFTALVAFFL